MGTRLAALNFEGLATIDDGRIDKLLKLHLARASQDCMDRPGDKTARTVSLQISVKPIVDQDGNCDTTSIEIECKSKVPVFRGQY